MPIYHKTTSTGNPNTAEIDYHTSEAAKVKRTREQAYFNSYDFDAIEVLPYDDDEDEDDCQLNTNFTAHAQGIAKSSKSAQISHIVHHHCHHRQKQQQQKPLGHSFNNASASKDCFIVDTCHYQQQQQQQQQLKQASNKSNSTNKPTAYLKRIAGLFYDKPGNSLKYDLKSATDALNSNSETVAESTKHSRNSSSKTSTTTSRTLSNTSSKENCNGIDTVVDNAFGSSNRELDRDAPYDYVMDETTRISPDDQKINFNTKAVSNGGEALLDGTITGGVAASDAVNNDGNFLMPRAMLKYQSSNLMPPGAVTTAASVVISMPLPANNNNNNTNSSTGFKQQQLQHHQLVTDTDSLDEVQKSNSNMAASSGGDGGVTNRLRLKKTSISSSLNSSMSFEELEEVEIEEERKEANKLKEEPKVLPKTSCINIKSSVRASSHQSHYSTDKSASSGYYSSNVCSTYSLEEHIYSEPTIDLKKLKHQPLKESVCERNMSLPTSSATKIKDSSTLKHKQQKQQHQPQQTSLASDPNSVMRTLDYTRRYSYADNNDLACSLPNTQTLPVKRKSQEFNENLKILESSIENLDRHLKTFPGLNSQEAFSLQDKQRHLPTIQEAFDSLKKTTSWAEDHSDDSLMDIDLDSFLLDKDKIKQEKTSHAKGLVNPTFLPEEQEENHYKCAKYINSCPEDAYRVDSDILAPAHSSISGQSLAVSVDLYPKRYEDQIHFENTRELLEDVRDKIRLLTQTQEQVGKQNATTLQPPKENSIPQELHTMINTLKRELELYLERMNQHSELEIRQLCSGLVKNQNIVKMKNAFERRRSLTETNDVYATYEAIQDGILVNNQGMPISIRQQQITSIRCSSDPNFKMKRKSITEVFPMAECYVEDKQTHTNTKAASTLQQLPTTQLQRNLSFHKPVLEQLSSVSAAASNHKTSSSGDNSDTNDKESILDWHRKKPSIWEMYYGTNRMQQSLLGVKKNGMMLTTTATSSPSTMCYPSSRPESDFTLDLPRAEQLRIKMEKEKKFRQRCRVITTFLSLVFFLLTVMVVSLVLTRGKRMFGSMI